MPKSTSLLTEISRLERELYALKTATKASPLLKGYSAKLLPPFNYWQGTQYIVFEIVYGDGNQPIITDQVGSVGVMFGAVNGNRQRVYLYTQYIPDFITLFSTRPIVAVNKLS